MLDKHHIVACIIRQLEADILIAEQAVKTARDTATHKDCLGSSKYETMGTEAAYLAHGQGRRLLAIQRALAYFKQLKLPESTASIALCSLVTLTDEHGQEKHVWVAGDAGGLEIRHNKKIITVITPQSPLGRALLGKEQGEEVEIHSAGKQHGYEISAIY